MNYDHIILGAGINGIALAKELASQGKKVAVIDKKTIACGASSHSSRLIHGGLRYLEAFDFPLVYEALHDRTRLIKKYPDLVQLRPFLLPVYTNSPRPAFMIRTGLFLYDLLSGFVAPHKKVPQNILDTTYKALKKDHLKKAYVYFDAKTNDLLLTQTLAKEAQALGVEIFENTLIDTIDVQDESITLEALEYSFTTQNLVNATGAWIDETNAKYGFKADYSITKVSGIHIVLDGLLVDEPVLLQTPKERIFFIIPENEKHQTLIGTTERDESVNIDDVTVNEEDIDYLLTQVNVYLQTPLTRSDVKESFIGVRPLIASKKSINKASREYQFDLQRMGKCKIMHIFGGKLTTHNSLAIKGAKKLFS